MGLASSLAKVAIGALVVGLLALAAGDISGQAPTPQLTLLSREGRRTLPLAVNQGQDMVALDDLAPVFQLAVREVAGALTVSYKGKTVVLTPDQTIASAAGRLISLPAAPSRVSGRWLVPVEFIGRGLAPIYDTRLDLRRASRLLVIGELRVPRVVIRHEPLGTSVQLAIDATPPAASTVTQEGPNRLTIRFDADAIDVAFPSFQPQGFVQALGTIEPATIHVELGPRFVSYRSAAETIDDTARLVLDVLGPPSAATAAQTTTDEPARLDFPRSAQSSRALRTLAIDAGHGGDEAGASGQAGTLEKDVTLAAARRLRAAVEMRLGLRVVMTREDDRTVPLMDRTAIANNNKADLLLSLHANASFRRSAAGAVVYVAQFDQSTEPVKVRVPERVPVFGGGFRDIEIVPWYLAQTAHRGRSEELAQLIVGRLQGLVPLGARPVDRAPLRVLESANMPAVLLEMGYLSNEDQERQLASGDFQNTIVQSLVDALMTFRGAGRSSGGEGR